MTTRAAAATGVFGSLGTSSNLISPYIRHPSHQTHYEEDSVDDRSDGPNRTDGPPLVRQGGRCPGASWRYHTVKNWVRAGIVTAHRERFGRYDAVWLDIDDALVAKLERLPRQR